MKIISFINERPVIRKILNHLNLWDNYQNQRPPPVRAGPKVSKWNNIPLPADTPHQHELFDDGWPGFEEPYISYD